MSFLNKFSIFTVVTILFSLFFIVLAVIAPVRKTVEKSTYKQVIELYDKSSNVYQSQKLGSEIEKIVRDRIDCYRHSPFERGNLCVTDYTIKLVDLGRQQIQSAPDLGSFLSNIPLCPIVHAVCIGNDNENPYECITMEAQCIDGMYDSYWRGRPFMK